MDKNSSKSGSSATGHALDPEFIRLIEEIKRGSQQAAWRVLELYGSHVVRVVRRHLSNEMRSKFDSSDFVQAVWSSFFTNCVHIQNFKNPTELISFLATVARNKVITETRRRHRASRDIRRERQLEERDDQRNFMISNADPADFTAARETWALLLEQQTARNRDIVTMKFMGDTEHDIAKHLHVSVRTVRRVLDRLLLQVGKRGP